MGIGNSASGIGHSAAIITLLLSAIFWLAAAPVMAELFPPEQRFVGMLADGTRVFGDRPHDWAEEALLPKLATLPVFDPAKPFRWIIDQAVPLGPEPGAYVEFIGGDRLLCQVVDYHPAGSDTFENVGEYLVVEPTTSVDLPSAPPAGFVRVSTDWLRRIVWERVSGAPAAYRPGTAFLRDGSQHPFKALRWAKGAVSILMEDGVKTLLMSQLAEIHFPQRNPWEAWFEQLGTLTPDLSERLIQIETSDGMRLTTSKLRYKQQFHGDKNKTDDWYPLFQPAWSLDPLVVPFRVIKTWRFFTAEEPPATMFDPVGSRAKSVFSGGWNWQLNRSVQGGPLRSANLLFGWGCGTHAPTELTLTLHPVVTGFRSVSGLDQVIRRGGCARSVVAYSNNVAVPLHRSEIVIGPDKVIDTGWLTLAAQADASVTLKLLSDPVIDERPAGADPFDVRDCIDWLEPQWRLDPVKLLTEVTRRLPKRIPALRDWTLAATLGIQPGSLAAVPEKPILKLTNVWDTHLPEDPHYRIDFEPVDRFLVLTRKLSIGKSDRWLALTLSRQAGALSTPSRVQVRANGIALGEGLVPERVGRGDPDPVLIPVSSLRGQTVELSVIVMTEGNKSRVDWRGSKLLKHHPGLVCLFDDEANFADELRDGEGTASLSTEEKQLGQVSLKLTVGDRGEASLPNVAFNIRETPKLGEFRFFRFAWKKVGGTAIGLQVAHDGMLGVLADGRKKQPIATMANHLHYRRKVPADNRGATFAYQYDIGNDKPVLQAALRLEKKPSGNWEAHTRDIYGEFGAFQLTGLGFRCPDGDAAYFDGLFLARTQADFVWAHEWSDILTTAAPNPDPNVLAAAAQPWVYGNLLSKVAPEFTTEASWDGVRWMKDIAGKEAVRTHPPVQGKPCILRSPLSVAAGKKTVLKLTCARRLDGDWQLAVLGEGQELIRVMVDATTAKDGWVSHEIDLSRFAGKNIVLEVHNTPNSWPNEDAFWSQVRIETQ